MADDTDTTVTSSAAREWLFKSRGQVFGPVPERRLLALVESGEIGPTTEVASDDGAWRSLADVPGFLVHVRRAEARARVESEVTAVQRLARRRGALRIAALATATVLLAGAAAAGAFWLAARRARTSALLEDFGGGIAIGGVTVGAVARGSADDEIAVPDAAGEPASAPRPKRIAAARPPAAQGAMEGGGHVLAQYDPKRIEEVVARRKGSLAPCLREESQRSPDFAGDIPIEFAVGNDGRVAQLWVLEARFKSGELRECLLRRLAEWSFDSFPGQRPIVSVAFRIGG